MGSGPVKTLRGLGAKQNIIFRIDGKPKGLPPLLSGGFKLLRKGAWLKLDDILVSTPPNDIINKKPALTVFGYLLVAICRGYNGVFLYPCIAIIAAVI